MHDKCSQCGQFTACIELAGQSRCEKALELALKRTEIDKSTVEITELKKKLAASWEVIDRLLNANTTDRDV